MFKKTDKSKVPLILINVFDRFAFFISFFYRRKRLTANHNFEEPFFIIGSGRSGNTLLRSMLVSSNQLSIPPESYVWPRSIRRFSSYSFMPWELLSSMIVSEFETYKEFNTWEVNLYKAHQETKKLKKKEQTLSNIINCIYQVYNKEKGFDGLRWGDKTPINTIYIDKIFKVFPQAQYIHIERNPLDVVCSYVKAGLYESYEEAAFFWKEATKKADALGKKLSTSQYYKISYEDLVTNPKIELEKICNFLKIEYRNSMLDYWKQKDDLGDVKYRDHHKNIGKPLTRSSIGKWKNQLTQTEVCKLKSILDL